MLLILCFSRCIPLLPNVLYIFWRVYSLNVNLPLIVNAYRQDLTTLLPSYILNMRNVMNI